MGAGSGILSVSVASKPASSLSMGATLRTDPIAVRGLANIAVQFVWSSGSSPVGVFTVEGSLDGENWSTLAVGSTMSVSGASGNYIWDGVTSCPMVRGVYTRTSGSATGKFLAYVKAV